MRYKGSIRAPEFPQGLEWINTPARLRYMSCAGKSFCSSSGPTVELIATTTSASWSDYVKCTLMNW